MGNYWLNGIVGSCALALVASAAVVIAAQEPAVVHPNFIIAKGSSFSASVPHSAQPPAGDLPPGRLEKITLDVEEALTIIRQKYAGKDGGDTARLTKSSI